MGHLLAAMNKRELESNRVTITNLLVRVQQGLKSSSPAVLHGSLLALSELFLYSGMVRPPLFFN